MKAKGDSNTLSLGAGLLAGFLPYFLGLISNGGYEVDSGHLLLNHAGLWGNLLHYPSNAWPLWKVPRILDFASGSSYTLLLSISFFIFAAGFSHLIRELKGSTSSSFFVPVIFSLLLLELFGFDTVIIMSSAFVPLLLYSLHRYFTSESTFTSVFFIATSVGSALFSNQLAPFIALSTFFIFILSGGPKDGKPMWKAIAFLFLPVLFSSSGVPDLLFPSFPRFSHVVPGYGTPFGIDPLIGQGNPLPVIDRTFTEGRRVSYLALLLLGASGFLFMISKSGVGRNFALSGAFIALSCVLSTQLVPGWASLLSPLGVLSRIIPRLIEFPLILPALFLSSMCLCISLAVSNLSSFFRNGGIFASGLLSLLLIPYSPLLLDRGTKDTLTSLVPLLSDPKIEKIIYSPSFAVLKRTGASRFEKLLNSSRLESITVKDTGTEVRASHNNEEISKLIDGNDATRWSTKLGEQNGSEWLMIQFSAVETLNGLEFSTTKNPTDFPRGIEIRGSSECGTNFENYTIIAAEEIWPGTLEKTDDGYPYFTAQSKVVVTFPNAASYRCFLIKQTGRDPSFEWSVGELKIVR